MKKNKIVFIYTISGIALILIILFLSYVIYGSTLLNPNNEEELIEYLTVEEEYPPTILSIEKIDDYFGVLYFDTTYDNITLSTAIFTRNKYYNNKYVLRGSYSTNSFSESSSFRLQNTAEDKILEDGTIRQYFYVFGYAGDESREFKIVCGKDVVFEDKTGTNEYYFRMFYIDATKKAAERYDILNLDIVE